MTNAFKLVLISQV